MSNRKKFLLNGILLTAVALAVRGVNLGFNAFVSRAVGAEALGLFTVIGTVYAFAVTFASSGINLTVTRLVASAVGEKKTGEIPRIMRHAVGYCLIFSLAATLVLFFGAGHFAEHVLSDRRAELPFKILSASLIPIALSAVFGGYFIGVKKIVRSSALQIASQIFKIGVTVFFVQRMSEGGVVSATVALCLSTTFAELFSCLISFLQFLFTKERSDGSGMPPFSAVSSMALPLAFSAYIRSALLTLEHVLIPARLRKSGESESSALASYGLLHGMALPVLLYPMTPLSSFSGLLVPEFAEAEASGDFERLKRIAEEVIRTTLCYSAPVAVFIYLFAEEIGYTVYDSWGAGHYIAMMAPVLPIMYLDHVTDAMLKGIGEQVYSMWVNISDSFLSVILIWVLIPRMGISGYALVIIIMEGYNFILSVLRLRKRISFSSVAFLSVLLPFFEAALAALTVKRLFAFGGGLTTPVWLILKIVFALSVFLALHFSLKAVSSLFKKRMLGRDFS